MILQVSKQVTNHSFSVHVKYKSLNKDAFYYFYLSYKCNEIEICNILKPVKYKQLETYSSLQNNWHPW